MKIYFIIPDQKAAIPPKNLLDTLDDYEIIEHKGRLSQIEKLKNDQVEKILAVDPDTFDWDLDAESVKNIPNVKAVMTSSTSFDWIKPETLRELGVDAFNVPGFSTESVAEYSLTMAVETARRLPVILKNNRKIDWDYTKPMLLKGKTAGIVGLGRIGSSVAKAAQSFGMNVIYWSRNSTNDAYKKVELSELFKTADVIFPTLVENAETEKLITNELLDTMKKTSILVGLYRIRGLWDENYVFEKVKKEEIWGYAIEGDDTKDLTEYEGNVWSLPAMAWYTRDSVDTLLKIWVENMKAYIAGKPQNQVN